MARKVKKAFTDRDTGSSYAAGDVYTSTDTRIAELESGGYLNKTDIKGDVNAEPSDPTATERTDASADSDG